MHSNIPKRLPWLIEMLQDLGVEDLRSGACRNYEFGVASDFPRSVAQVVLQASERKSTV